MESTKNKISNYFYDTWWKCYEPKYYSLYKSLIVEVLDKIATIKRRTRWQ